MADRSIEILSNEELLKTLSQNAAKRATEFSPELIVPKYEAYYHKILNRCREFSH